MEKYFNIIFKRLMKFFPFVLIVTIVLFAGLTVIYGGIIQMQNNDENNKIFKIGITGDTDHKYFQLGKTALTTFDDTRFSMELVDMSEDEAKEALYNGDISAYVIIPDGFVEKAIYGEIIPIKYITSPGTTGIITIFKDEVTNTIQELVVNSQKGVFGLETALKKLKYDGDVYKHVNSLNVEYIQYIIARGNMYKSSEMGISNGLSFVEYTACGIAVLFVLLVSLPYAAVFVKKDRSLNRMLAAQNFGSFKQVFNEFLAQLLLTIISCAILIGLLFVIITTFGLKEFLGVTNSADILSLFVNTLPAILFASAFSIMLFELANDIISGVMTHFFVTLFICYFTGCIFPVYTLPNTVQKLSAFFPTAMARNLIAEGFGGQSLYDLIGIVVFVLIFLCCAALLRRRKILYKG